MCKQVCLHEQVQTVEHGVLEACILLSLTLTLSLFPASRNATRTEIAANLMR